jgi:Cu(I)/Ag(I) efflux system membrane fusion protein
MIIMSKTARHWAVARGATIVSTALALSIAFPDLAALLVRDAVWPIADGTPRLASTWHSTARAEKAAENGKVTYTCPMHPHYISDHAGTCPICGMDLVKVETGPAVGASTSKSRQIVTIAPEVIQNMGVRIAPAERASFGLWVRATAVVMENERTRSVITARVEGWIEDLKVTAVGDVVTKGTKLFELFAPELVVSQRDYLTAMRERDSRRMEDTETRLRAFGVQDQVIRQLAANGREMQKVPFHSDRDGVIAELPVVNGEYLRRGATVLRIQDYGTVWMAVNLAEKDLALIGPKTQAVVSLPSLPGRTFETRVDYVYPTIDAKTRTGRARLVVDNPDGVIRPGSFADVSFQVDTDSRLAVRSEAILLSEQGAYIVVAVGEGRFEPRRVKTGVASGGWTEVFEGVAPGEQVVVSGQFLIDSESALRESFHKLQRLQTPLPLLAPTKTELAMIDHLVDAAIYLHEALVDGYQIEPKFLQAALDIKDQLWPKFGRTKLGFVLQDAALAIRQAQAARSESEHRSALARLVAAIEPWMMEGAPKHYAEKKVSLFQEDGGSRKWVQLGERSVNPYGTASASRVPWPAHATKTDTPAAAPSSGPASSAAASAVGHGAPVPERRE